MNLQEFNFHKEQAFDKWVRLESFYLAYNRTYRRTKLVSTILGWGTVIAGVLTAISGLWEAENLASGLTPFAATITAATALIKQTFVSDGKSASLWKLQLELQSEKENITSYIRLLALNGREELIDNFYEQLNGRINTLASANETLISSAFKEQAEKNLYRSRISRVEFDQSDTDDEDDDEITLPVGQDLEGVTPVSRGI